jgi:hypothetical protein
MELLIGKIDTRLLYGCSVCRSYLATIESIRRSDGNVLQLHTCNECNQKWKELWLQL